MRRPGFLGDLDGFWFSGFGLVHTPGMNDEVWDHYGRDIGAPSSPAQMLGPAAYQREVQSSLSRGQGWLTSPVRQQQQNVQLPAARPLPAKHGRAWIPFDFDHGVW